MKIIKIHLVIVIKMLPFFRASGVRSRGSGAGLLVEKLDAEEPLYEECFSIHGLRKGALSTD
jgi:hypothetical protein